MRYSCHLAGRNLAIFLSEEVFDVLSDVRWKAFRQRIDAVLIRLADAGEIRDITKFRHVGEQIYEVKGGPMRIYGWLDRVGGGRAYFGAVITKKESAKMDPNDHAKACRARLRVQGGHDEIDF